MTKKICIACDKNKFQTAFSQEEDKPNWITKAGRTNLVPLENMPSMDNVEMVDIHVPELAKKTIYYWATDSEFMKQVVDQEHPCIKNLNCGAEYAYGNYCNSGITRLDHKGKTTVYVERPIGYKEEGNYYDPHIHFAVYDNKNKHWINEMYTLPIE